LAAARGALATSDEAIPGAVARHLHCIYGVFGRVLFSMEDAMTIDSSRGVSMKRPPVARPPVAHGGTEASWLVPLFVVLAACADGDSPPVNGHPIETVSPPPTTMVTTLSPNPGEDGVFDVRDLDGTDRGDDRDALGGAGGIGGIGGAGGTLGSSGVPGLGGSSGFGGSSGSAGLGGA
jgi:uncharacterized membrane protein YgcG